MSDGFGGQETHVLFRVPTPIGRLVSLYLSAPVGVDAPELGFVGRGAGF